MMDCPKAKVAKAIQNYNAKIKTDMAANTSLSIGSRIIDLLKRDRHYQYDYHFEPNDRVGECDIQLEKTDVTANLKDEWTAIDSEIIYVDPRNDLVVYRETTVSIKYNKAPDTFNTIPHYTFWYELPITISKTVRTISSLDGVLEESVTDFSKNIKLCLGTGFGHLDKRFVDDMFYSYNEGVETTDLKNRDRDGWGWLYPYYLHDYFSGKERDYQYRELVDTFIAGAVIGEPATEETTVFDLLADDFPQGSWAFDRDGNMFMSQMLSDGILNLLRSTGGVLGDPVSLTDLEGDNPVFYPISPV